MAETATGPRGGLYVHRNLAPDSAKRLHDWAAAAGIPNLTPPEELHVTIVYSRADVTLEPRTEPVAIDLSGAKLAPLGDKGAVVLMFASPTLAARWQEARDVGASWDHEGGYKPHVTITYDAGGADLSAVDTSGLGTFELGPEQHEPINENWAEDKGLRMADQVLKFHEDQRIVEGWASVIEVGGQTVIDYHGDIIAEAALVKAAHGFMLNSRAGRLMHRGLPVGEVVESMVFTAERQKTLGISLGKVGWYIAMKIHDAEVWAKVKDGTYRAFSIGGSATPVEVPDAA